MSQTKLLLFIIAAILLSIIFLESMSFVILKYFTNNGIFREYKPRFEFDPIFGRQMQKNYISNGKNITDEFGRAITPTYFKNPDIKVVITGGSSVFQSSSRNNEKSIPSLLEKKIYQFYNLKAEVINLALPGYTSYQELMRLHDFFLTNKADIVISVSGYNDVTSRFEVAKITDAQIFKGKNEKRYDLIFDTRYFNKLKVIKELEEEKFVFYNFGYLLRSHSFFFELIDRIFRKLNSITKTSTEKEIIDYHDTIKINLTKDILKIAEEEAKRKSKISFSHYVMMEALAEINNSDYYLFLQPSALNWSFFNESKVYKDYHDYEKELNPIYKFNLNTIYDEIIGFNRNHIKHLFDFRDIMNNSKDELYVDHIHYTDQGTNILAEEILKILHDNLSNI